VNRQIGVKVSKFAVVSGPYLQVTWHSTCALAVSVYITGLDIIMAVTQKLVNTDTCYLSIG